MAEGWIKVHRKLLDSAIFQNESLLKVWMWCLLKADYREHDTYIGSQKVHVMPGQFIFGRRAAAEELRMNESSLYRCMQRLQSEQQISIKANNKFSLVTIVNWAFYQGEVADLNNKRTTDEQQMNTPKEYIKNGKNIIYVPTKKGSFGTFGQNVYDFKMLEDQIKDN